jgi:ferredoxin
MSTATPSHWKLARRYGRIPFRSPVNELLSEMMAAVFSEEEAELASSFPVRPGTVEAIARSARVPDDDAHRLIAAMDGRGVIGSYAADGDRRYMLLPIVPGLFELVMWSGRTDARAKRFAELYEQYYDRDYFSSKPGGVIKIIAVEKHIDSQVGVLPTDRVSELIDSHTRFSLTSCCCRHSAELRGEPCAKPKEVCMAFGPLSEFLVQRNLARPVEKSEIFDVAERAAEAGLVHLTDNVADANFLCSCCSCCCTGLKVITRFSYPWMIAKSHFVADVDESRCEACGKCARRCPTAALTAGKRQLSFDPNQCIGCGVCVSACNRNAALSLDPRPRYQPPNASFGALATDLGLCRRSAPCGWWPSGFPEPTGDSAGWSSAASNAACDRSSSGQRGFRAQTPANLL